LLSELVVEVASAEAVLEMGMDESYTLSISASGATLGAPTVWGALRGLESMSQLSRHTWTTSATGSVNASFNEVCAALVTDAPRFPFRGLMIDTSRHFMPVSVIKQVIDLMTYLKMNALRLHLIDTNSWSYYVEDLPVVSNTSAFSPLHVYYAADLSELVEFGRMRGVMVYPEIDFPSHSQGILASIPEMGCSLPNGDRVYIDPMYGELWSTMGKIFGGLNAIFPPQYPFHMGGDEVDRNTWAQCPSVIDFAKTKGVTNNIANFITDWWYTQMYNFLAAPPYNRVVMAWEDITDAVNASTWPGASTGGLIIEQWNGNPGEWQSGTCSIASSSNASVLISGPFHDVIGKPPSFNSNPEENYADMYNLSCSLTPRLQTQIVGPELMFWDDAADISATDMVGSFYSAPGFAPFTRPPSTPNPPPV